MAAEEACNGGQKDAAEAAKAEANKDFKGELNLRVEKECLRSLRIPCC